MRILVPGVGNQQGDRPRSNVEGAMDNPARRIARNRNAGWLTDMALTTRPRRRFGDNRFVQHENGRPLARQKAVF
jgi:hypothetical protein